MARKRYIKRTSFDLGLIHRRTTIRHYVVRKNRWPYERSADLALGQCSIQVLSDDRLAKHSFALAATFYNQWSNGTF